MLAKAGWTAGGWRGQLLLYLCAYTAYSAMRWIVVGDPVRASAHARFILRLEHALHLGVEGTVQRALDAGVPIWLLNHLYLLAQLAVLPGALIWLFAHAPAVYRTLRDTVLATWLLAMPIYALFPVAPPRLARIGIVDTISRHSTVNLGSHLTTSFYNPLAAVPSLHAGFAFAVGTALAIALRRRWAKALALLWGPAVALSVVATGNHFLFDIAAGLLATAAGFALGLGLARRWPGPTRRQRGRAGLLAPSAQTADWQPGKRRGDPHRRRLRNLAAGKLAGRVHARRAKGGLRIPRPVVHRPEPAALDIRLTKLRPRGHPGPPEHSAPGSSGPA